jgi:hypothetical protein
LAADNGDLVLLAGVDKRKPPKSGIMGDPVNGGHSGLVTIDIFDSAPAHRIAALDVVSQVSVNIARRRVSLVSSRWVAIALDFYHPKMLLLNFKPSGAQVK